MSCLIGKSPENAGFNGKITHHWHLDYSISPVFPAHIRGSRSTGKKGDAERAGVARLEGKGHVRDRILAHSPVCLKLDIPEAHQHNYMYL